MNFVLQYFFFFKGNLLCKVAWESKTWRRKTWESKPCNYIYSWKCNSDNWYESGMSIFFSINVIIFMINNLIGIKITKYWDKWSSSVILCKLASIFFVVLFFFWTLKINNLIGTFRGIVSSFTKLQLLETQFDKWPYISNLFCFNPRQDVLEVPHTSQ